MFDCVRLAVEMLGWSIVCILLVGLLIKFLLDGDINDND
jgi:hypothetical protein